MVFDLIGSRKSNDRSVSKPGALIQINVIDFWGRDVALLHPGYAAEGE
jgi:hypothetical protein